MVLLKRGHIRRGPYSGTGDKKEEGENQDDQRCERLNTPPAPWKIFWASRPATQKRAMRSATVRVRIHCILLNMFNSMYIHCLGITLQNGGRQQYAVS